jgi:RNA recognition motif-containing protein
MDVTLYVGNLSTTTGEDELLSLFTAMGAVTTLRIMRDRHSGLSRGYGYLTMSAQSEADKAVSRLNDYSLNGNQLKVSLSRPRAEGGTAGL